MIEAKTVVKLAKEGLIIYIIKDALCKQRLDLICLMKTINHKSLKHEYLQQWLESIVFSEVDILEQAIKGFCDYRYVETDVWNELRDYQHETVQLCLDAFDNTLEMKMLVLGRETGGKIIINEELIIEVVAIYKDFVKLGFTGQKNKYIIDRIEIYEMKQQNSY